MSDRWPDKTGFVKEYEFNRPDIMTTDLIHALGSTRLFLNRPMFFSVGPRDRIYHPNGDAVPMEHAGHSLGSLHRAGMDHNMTARKNEKVPCEGAGGLAQDWDCEAESGEELFDVYLQIEKLNLWNGIGLYLWWSGPDSEPRPGFHTDIRSRLHPSFGARWFRDKAGLYRPLKYSLFKQEMERFTREAGRILYYP